MRVEVKDADGNIRGIWVGKKGKLNQRQSLELAVLREEIENKYVQNLWKIARRIADTYLKDVERLEVHHDLEQRNRIFKAKVKGFLERAEINFHSNGTATLVFKTLIVGPVLLTDFSIKGDESDER